MYKCVYRGDLFEEDFYSGCVGGSDAFFLHERQFFTGGDISDSSFADNCRNQYSHICGDRNDSRAHHNTDYYKANYTADHHISDNNHYHNNYDRNHYHNNNYYHDNGCHCHNCHAGDYPGIHRGADHRREKTRAG